MFLVFQNNAEIVHILFLNASFVKSFLWALTFEEHFQWYSKHGCMKTFKNNKGSVK